jgi:hypothetical protein
MEADMMTYDEAIQTVAQAREDFMNRKPTLAYVPETSIALFYNKDVELVQLDLLMAQRAIEAEESVPNFLKKDLTLA